MTDRLCIAPLVISIEAGELPSGEILAFKLTEPRPCFAVLRQSEGRTSIVSLHDSEEEATEMLKGLNARRVAAEGRGALQ
ncbi:hypothetical protein ACFFP0_19285 [Rhizobium puerariae]|uniref:Uncharacterized protein n=1 Tax=Rhizobium puerariae TaxID=1585791 RepID=A0ABV6AKB9_9HYPH